MKGSVISVNISVAKGTIKQPVAHIDLELSGISNDAHAGNWHRQVSLLAQESIDRFGAEANSSFKPGEFAENLTTQGLDLLKINRLDHICIGDVLLEVTQIGKSCHGGGCAIYREVGRCVMPKEGIFARVIKPGKIAAGDPISVIRNPLKIKIITLSDRVYEGVYKDRSGPAIEARLQPYLESINWGAACECIVLPDDASLLDQAISDAIASDCDLLFATGGTGIGPRDITPDVIGPKLEKEFHGVMEHIRIKHAERLPSSLISRSQAGTIGRSLVFTLPGSVKAVNEYLDEILKLLDHALIMVRGWENH